MTTASTIPTVAPPDVSSITVLVGGQEIPSEIEVLSASVSRELGRIPSASLQLRDGEASKQTFAVSETDHFVPGKEVEVRLGYRGETESVFLGVIVAHRVRVRKNGTLLSIECRDKAVRMTRGRKSRYYADAADSDIIDELIGEHGLDRTVKATQPSHEAVVQYDSTDWDFLVCRAEANGFVVAVLDGRVDVGPPDVGGEPVVSTAFGATVLELDAEIDARWQAPGITATAWDAAEQTVLTADAAEPSVTASGDLTATSLASVLGGDAHVLRHGGRLDEPELQAWADGRLLKDRLAKVRGRVRFQGFGGVGPGDVIEVEGIGSRFVGPQFVSGVRHTFASGNWETDVAFGLAPDTHVSRYPVASPAAGGLLPAVSGLHVGIVTSLEDPDGEDRIRVRLPLISDAEDGAWARLATLDAGSERGTYFRPEIDDEVVVGFLDSDPRFPVVLGQCHSSAKPAPEPGSDDNHRKGLQTRSKLKLTFDDDRKSIVVETPSGNTLTLSDDEKTASLVDQHGNSVILDDGGITLKSAKDVTIEAGGKLELKGAGVSVSSQAALELKGQSGAEVSSSAVLTLKGSLVRIN
jgi:Rhs element Vgr protein